MVGIRVSGLKAPACRFANCDDRAGREEGKMETRMFSKSWVSTIIYYSMLVWTAICFIGTWVVILKYGILLEGAFAVGMTFFIAIFFWAILLTVLILLTLFIGPSEEPPPSIMFKELIRRGMRQGSG